MELTYGISLEKRFLNKTTFVFASTEEAEKLIRNEDAYINALTHFDLQAKIKTLGAVNKRDYIANAVLYIYNWLPFEVNYLSIIIADTERKLLKLNLQFELPDTIFLIKSAMHEEGNANGYTRSNMIFLNFNSLSEHLFLHELFHIVSRFNESRQEKAYELLGFTKCNEIRLPQPFANRKITNPDAPFNNFYIKLKHQGINVEAILLIYSFSNYEGGSFFRYVNKGLLVVNGPDDAKEPLLVDGRPLVLSFNEVEGLFEQIGRNTGYNIHQEEVTADHFVMLLEGKEGLPNQELIKGLRKVFS